MTVTHRRASAPPSHRGTAAAALAHRYTWPELVRQAADLLTDHANRLPDGRLRPSAVRRLTNLRWALQIIHDATPRRNP